MYTYFFFLSDRWFASSFFLLYQKSISFYILFSIFQVHYLAWVWLTTTIVTHDIFQSPDIFLSTLPRFSKNYSNFFSFLSLRFTSLNAAIFFFFRLLSFLCTYHVSNFSDILCRIFFFIILISILHNFYPFYNYCQPFYTFMNHTQQNVI